MNIWKPDYYDEFSCSASDCSYTCCRELAIAVDEETREKWKKLTIPEIVKGIAGFSGKTHLTDLVKRGRDGAVIELCGNGNCPLLSEKKLCNVVLAYGEESISRTCHTFPRKCQRYEKHLEYSLDLGCPEALELLWKKGAFTLEKYETEELTGSMKELADAADETGEEDAVLFLIREEAARLIAREDIPVTKAWIMLFGLLLDFYEKKNQLTAEYVKGMFSDHVVNQLKETVLRAQRDLIDHFTEKNELFLDISENYRKKKLYESVLEELADRAEWFELTDDVYVTDTCEEFEHVWEKMEHRIRLVMQEALYSGMLLPGGDLYSMILKTEWMALMLTMIRHGLFLRWELDEELDPEKAKDVIVVLLRMTGYSEADIEEYLEQSFQEPVWSWGYMALIV